MSFKSLRGASLALFDWVSIVVARHGMLPPTQREPEPLQARIPLGLVLPWRSFVVFRATACGATHFGLGACNASIRIGFNQDLLIAPTMFSPISMSAISMEIIEKAVFASRPCTIAPLEICAGISSTSMWESADPIAETIPWPTRAVMVLFGCPTDQLVQVGSTVTLAPTKSSTPFLATALSECLPSPS